LFHGISHGKLTPGAFLTKCIKVYAEILDKKGLVGVWRTYQLIKIELQNMKWTKATGYNLAPEWEFRFKDHP